MSNDSDSLSIKGTPLSGRPWKKDAKPKRALAKSSGARSKQKWLESQAFKNSMKEISAEASEAIKRSREERRLKAQRLKEKREKKQENEIRSAGNNVVVVSNKKVSKMTKKARRKLLKMTPEMLRMLTKK
ncbi:hypothetical protein BgAZ_100210 [Babesia gibsoni]|uniref:Coiled-coil domain-containing protein 86 n=1 Tax=Babesia gibsoni TaxID=33632 RepID=A0AAD8UR27_BABGI|nr:hypothetical protein BgAZ_100210 [Babesia gibsoni]